MPSPPPPPGPRLPALQVQRGVDGLLATAATGVGEQMVVVLDCRGASSLGITRHLHLLKKLAVTLNTHYPVRGDGGDGGAHPTPSPRGGGSTSPRGSCGLGGGAFGRCQCKDMQVRAGQVPPASAANRPLAGSLLPGPIWPSPPPHPPPPLSRSDLLPHSPTHPALPSPPPPQDHLYRLYLLELPLLLRWVVTGVTPLLDPVTRSKLVLSTITDSDLPVTVAFLTKRWVVGRVVGWGIGQGVRA